jgi:hypothetical protein
MNAAGRLPGIHARRRAPSACPPMDPFVAGTLPGRALWTRRSVVHWRSRPDHGKDPSWRRVEIPNTLGGAGLLWASIMPPGGACFEIPITQEPVGLLTPLEADGKCPDARHSKSRGMRIIPPTAGHMGVFRQPPGQPSRCSVPATYGYLAYSTALVSRITVTRICPG